MHPRALFPKFTSFVLGGCGLRALCRRLIPVGIVLAVALENHAAQVAPPTRQLITGHLLSPSLLSQPVGTPDPAMPLKLAIGLPWFDQGGIEKLVRDLYEPAGPDYHRFLTADAFARRFAPSDEDYSAVALFLKSEGLRLTAVHSNRMLLNVDTDVATAERVLGIHFHLYAHPTEARTFYAADREPSLPLATRILHIAGLDNFNLPRPRLHRTAPPPASGVGAPRLGSGPSGAYIGTDFRNAYVPGTTLTGAGQSIGLIALDGYYASDISGYASKAGITAPPLKNVLIDGFSGSPSGRLPGSANEEVALDIQMAMSMAPGVTQILVYEATPDSLLPSIENLMNRMATDNLARQLSSSWGYDIDVIIQQILQQYAAQGQSFFLASGDDGAFAGPVAQASDNPLMTVVGGTVLTTDTSHRWVSEKVWNGTGGGFSTVFPLPDWQRGIDMTANGGSTAFRNLPDVAMLGDNVWSMSDRGQSAFYQGTSIAAPLWAGFTALVNQQAALLGKPPVGFLNPALYRLGKDARYATLFHDIVVGDNTSANSPALFEAVTGYDLCSGWGTPRGTALIEALASLSPADPLQIMPPVGFVFIDPVRVGFRATNRAYTLTNTGTQRLPWSIAGIPTWVTATATSGSLGAGETVTITLALNDTDKRLILGSHSAVVSFVNGATGLRQGRDLSVTRRNGDFELGDTTDWSLNADPANTFVDTVDTSILTGSQSIPGFDDSVFVHSGINGLFLGENTAPGSLSQTLPTTSGASYQVSFWVTNPMEGTPNEFRAMWNGAVMLGQTNVGAFAWTQYRYTVAASSTQTRLRFEFRNDDYAFGLDDVQVELVPDSTLQIQIVTISPGNLVVAWNGDAGTVYQVQSLGALGSGSWVNVGDPLIGTGMPMSQGVQSSAGQQTFYRVITTP